MVMPLVDEDLPKCYTCHKTFPSLEALRDHQKSEHAAAKIPPREPAPGDVTVF